ncbi:MAG: helix-turn-helix domain-containing protein [Pseudonocardiaceae bacterium]
MRGGLAGEDPGMGKANADGRVCLACRVTVLSRYNPDALCSVCVRASRDSTQIVPAWLWDSAPLRAALARVDLAAFVVIFREAAELSQTELGNLVDGWSQSMVSFIERGLRDTLYDIRTLLAFADAVGMPRTALAPLILGHPDATLEGDSEVTLQGVDAVDMGRRDFGMLAAGLAVAAMLPVPQRVDRAHVRYLQAVLTRLRAQSNTAGGGAVLPQALQYFTQARRMLDESDYTEAVGRELLVLTADLGIESAWFAFDANHQALARRLHEEAALVVDSAGAGEQRAHLYVNMTYQGTTLAHDTGQPHYAREARRFAVRAAEALRYEPSPALHAFASLRSAVAHAQLGDEVAFRSAITTARRELDRGPHETDPTWTQFLNHSEITFSEAAGSGHLGESARAVRLYQSLIDDSAHSPLGQAVYRSKLAEALVMAGDLDQAIAHGLMILPDLGKTLTSGRVLRNLRPVRDAADTTTAEFCDRFDTAARALHTALPRFTHSASADLRHRA